MMQESVDALQAGRESSDRSPSALLAPRIPAPSEQLALCCLKCAVDDLLYVKCREVPEDQEGPERCQRISGSTRSMAKGGVGHRGYTGSQHSQSAWGWAVVGRETFKGDCFHVGRDIELEKQSTCHSDLCAHSSTLRQVQDENLLGTRGVPMSYPSG